jgi:hypothetical protein
MENRIIFLSGIVAGATIILGAQMLSNQYEKSMTLCRSIEVLSQRTTLLESRINTDVIPTMNQMRNNLTSINAQISNADNNNVSKSDFYSLVQRIDEIRNRLQNHGVLP